MIAKPLYEQIEFLDKCRSSFGVTNQKRVEINTNIKDSYWDQIPDEQALKKIIRKPFNRLDEDIAAFDRRVCANQKRSCCTKNYNYFELLNMQNRAEEALSKIAQNSFRNKVRILIYLYVTLMKRCDIFSNNV